MYCRRRLKYPFLTVCLLNLDINISNNLTKFQLYQFLDSWDSRKLAGSERRKPFYSVWIIASHRLP